MINVDLTYTPDITVIMATYRRPHMLRATLESMLRLDRAGLNVEWVIVDNNSGDDTGAVIQEFAERLPLRDLFEPRPGKNRALNHALNTVALGRLVVFTDDDVEPTHDWLRAIHDSARRLPRVKVFGGPVEPIWPGPTRPKWTHWPLVAGSFYGRLDLGNEPRPFPPGRYPAGANFWVRREIFDNGLRYDERFGPAHDQRLEASEVSLLAGLARDGEAVQYIPDAKLGHRIESHQLSLAFVRQRAWQCGRTGPHLNGISLTRLYRRSPMLWRIARSLSTARYALIYGLLSCSPWPAHRMRAIVSGLWGMANNIEQLRLVRAGRDPIAPTRLSPAIDTQPVGKGGGHG